MSFNSARRLFLLVDLAHSKRCSAVSSAVLNRIEVCRCMYFDLGHLVRLQAVVTTSPELHFYVCLRLFILLPSFPSSHLAFFSHKPCVRPSPIPHLSHTFPHLPIHLRTVLCTHPRAHLIHPHPHPSEPSPCHHPRAAIPVPKDTHQDTHQDTAQDKIPHPRPNRFEISSSGLKPAGPPGLG